MEIRPRNPPSRDSMEDLLAESALHAAKLLSSSARIIKSRGSTLLQKLPISHHFFTSNRQRSGSMSAIVSLTARPTATQLRSRFAEKHLPPELSISLSTSLPPRWRHGPNPFEMALIYSTLTFQDPMPTPIRTASRTFSNLS